MMETITFESKDGLKITADYYQVEKPKGFILLCHRSHYNRGEYRETAPRFNKLGYACLAIDQRSGMTVLGVVNETKKLAKLKGLPMGYLEAKPDIESAIAYAYGQNGNKPIILLGSSYSASLALLIATKCDQIKATVVFSPGEYLKGIKLAGQLRPMDKPIFATSAKKEIRQVSDLLACVDKKLITHFKPDVEGFHGARALWNSVKGNETYWKSLEGFLEKIA